MSKYLTLLNEKDEMIIFPLKLKCPWCNEYMEMGASPIWIKSIDDPDIKSSDGKVYKVTYVCEKAYDENGNYKSDHPQNRVVLTRMFGVKGFDGYADDEVILKEQITKDGGELCHHGKEL